MGTIWQRENGGSQNSCGVFLPVDLQLKQKETNGFLTSNHAIANHAMVISNFVHINILHVVIPNFSDIAVYWLSCEINFIKTAGGLVSSGSNNIRIFSVKLMVN